MARPQKLIPSYRKHKAIGQAVVTIDGRDFYLGPHGTKASHVEYDRLVAEWLASGRALTRDQAELTVVELAAAYLRHAKRYYRHDGRATSEYAAIVAALRPVKALYGRKPCSEFGPIALQAVMQTMVNDGLARSTVNQNASRIKRMVRWGVSQELIAASIAHALGSVDGLRKGRSGARETAPVKPVPDAVVDATITELPTVVGDMVRVQRWTGCRPNEVCGMRPMDIDRSVDPWR